MRKILSAFFFPQTPPTLASDLAGFAIFVAPFVALAALVKFLG